MYVFHLWDPHAACAFCLLLRREGAVVRQGALFYRENRYEVGAGLWDPMSFGGSIDQVAIFPGARNMRMGLFCLRRRGGGYESAAICSKQ